MSSRNLESSSELSEHKRSRSRLELRVDWIWTISFTDNNHFGWCDVFGRVILRKLQRSLRTASNSKITLSSWHSLGTESQSELWSIYGVHLPERRTFWSTLFRASEVCFWNQLLFVLSCVVFETSRCTPRERCSSVTMKHVTYTWSHG